MTASKPDLKVLAVGADALAHHWRGSDTHTLVVCEMPDDLPILPAPGNTRDLCEPGFRVAVGAALAEAGIPLAGGPGIELLAKRASGWRDVVNRVRAAVGLESTLLAEPHDTGTAQVLSRVRAEISRSIALAQAVQSIGQVLADMGRDLMVQKLRSETRPVARAADALGTTAKACEAISEIVESVAADVVAPTMTARDVLAAHGWREEKAPHEWVNSVRETDVGSAWIEDGRVTFEGRLLSPAELRAFATLAEESKP